VGSRPYQIGIAKRNDLHIILREGGCLQPKHVEEITKMKNMFLLCIFNQNYFLGLIQSRLNLENAC
jgi:hypothetical protein